LAKGPQEEKEEETEKGKETKRTKRNKRKQRKEKKKKEREGKRKEGKEGRKGREGRGKGEERCLTSLLQGTFPHPQGVINSLSSLFWGIINFFVFL